MWETTEETLIVTICYILLHVAQASIFGFCMYRALSLGRAYERELTEKCPAVAEKRHADPFYRVTLPGARLYWHPTGEDELDDASLRRKGKAISCYWIGAFMILTLPALAALIVSGLRR